DGIVITPDGKTAYVANAGSNSITPINLTTKTPGTPITGGFATPRELAITPDGRKLYVPNNVAGSTTITPVHPATGTVEAPISTGVATPYWVQFVGGASNVADITLTASQSAATVQVGSNVTYNLAVSNAGPNVSTGTTISYPLPAGVSFVSATS